MALSVLLNGLSAAPAAARYGRWYSAHPRPGELMEAGSVTEVRPRGPRPRS